MTREQRSGTPQPGLIAELDPPGRGGVNPYYDAYAKAHGTTPAKMLAHDRKAWPGGCMTGFIVWIARQWREWETAHDFTYDVYGRPSRPKTDADHASFAAWLDGQLVTTEAA